ncbi:MAG: T9SS type A sorting domain-containing protein, partial [candidate division WOR-3 bacterium]|nr:T9SS type A sorting domain-containing protein [candidate division WOR-3 bacterium]
NEFWKYRPNFPYGEWFPLETIPRLNKKGGPKTGSALACAQGMVWLLKGNNTNEFWRYYVPLSEKSKTLQPSNASVSQTIANQLPRINISPNPFTKQTTIRYTVPVAGNVSIKLYNVAGKLIATLVNNDLKPGNYTLTLSKDKLAKGIYFLKCETKNNSAKAKLIIQ